MHQYQPSRIVVVVLLVIELIHTNVVFTFGVFFLIYCTVRVEYQFTPHIQVVVHSVPNG